MPLYEFVCRPCKDKFEVLTSPSKMSEARCPRCGSGNVKRVFSPFYSPRSGSGSSGGSGSCAGCSSGNCGSCSH